MEYFILSQDERITDRIQLSSEAKQQLKTLLQREKISKIGEHLSLRLQANGGRYYPDFVDAPLPLFSPEMKALLEQYDAQLFFTPVFLFHPKENRQDLYWLLIPDVVDCLAEQSEWHKDGSLKRLVIQPEQVAFYPCFQVAGVREKLLVIRLDVAESFLRRGFTGMHLQKIEQARSG